MGSVAAAQMKTGRPTRVEKRDDLKKFTVKLPGESWNQLEQLGRDLERQAGSQVRGAKSIVLRRLIDEAFRKRSD